MNGIVGGVLIAIGLMFPMGSFLSAVMDRNGIYAAFKAPGESQTEANARGKAVSKRLAQNWHKMRWVGLPLIIAGIVVAVL